MFYTSKAAVERASCVPILRWGSTISHALSSCAVRTTSWNGEPSGSVWTDRSAGRASQGHNVSGWTLRYALAPSALKRGGGRVSRAFYWGHRRETDTVKRGVDTSETWGVVRKLSSDHNLSPHRDLLAIQPGRLAADTLCVNTLLPDQPLPFPPVLI